MAPHAIPAVEERQRVDGGAGDGADGRERVERDVLSVLPLALTQEVQQK